jgi:hypothetical protein
MNKSDVTIAVDGKLLKLIKMLVKIKGDLNLKEAYSDIIQDYKLFLKLLLKNS